MTGSCSVGEVSVFKKLIHQDGAVILDLGIWDLSGLGDYVFRSPLGSEKQIEVVCACLVLIFWKKETPPNILKQGDYETY